MGPDSMVRSRSRFRPPMPFGVSPPSYFPSITCHHPMPLNPPIGSDGVAPPAICPLPQGPHGVAPLPSRLPRRRLRAASAAAAMFWRSKKKPGQKKGFFSPGWAIQP